MTRRNTPKHDGEFYSVPFDEVCDRLNLPRESGDSSRVSSGPGEVTNLQMIEAMLEDPWVQKQLAEQLAEQNAEQHAEL